MAWDKIMDKRNAKKSRKYVWYDYSNVEKARIQIIRSDVPIGSCIPGTQRELSLHCELPVQINPADFNYVHRVEPYSIIRKLGGSQNVAEGFVLNSYGDIDRSPITIPLIYDIYDEYNARTMNGTITKDFSLMREDSTSLPLLVKFAKENGVYARFIWGDIDKFGLLSGIDINYTAFSPWGNPLKATATIYITEQNTVGKLHIRGDLGLSKLKTVAKKVVNGAKNVFR